MELLRREARLAEVGTIQGEDGEPGMIPVRPQTPPKNFDAKVRVPGLAWLATNNIPLAGKIPKGTKLPPHWRSVLPALHKKYDGVCAYLCVFDHRETGGVSTDHYVAKSRAAGQAYEWSNYRLACTAMNTKKRDYATVVDPFTLPGDSYRLDLVTGKMFPNPALPEATQRVLRVSMRRLGLDRPNRAMRAKYVGEYIAMRGPAPNPAVEDHLKRHAPFVWYEAQRQGLL